VKKGQDQESDDNDCAVNAKAQEVALAVCRPENEPNDERTGEQPKQQTSSSDEVSSPVALV
jgi:hypothetical protein